MTLMLTDIHHIWLLQQVLCGMLTQMQLLRNSVWQHQCLLIDR